MMKPLLKSIDCVMNKIELPPLNIHAESVEKIRILVSSFFFFQTKKKKKTHRRTLFFLKCFASGPNQMSI